MGAKPVPNTNLSDLEAFLAVARLRNFRHAAKERGVSPSAVSQTIRNLEERLGVRLLNRTTRSVATTHAGERLVRQISSAITDIDEALRAIHASSDQPSGRVRINSPAPAVEYMLMPFVSEFLETYPEISLELIASDSMDDVVGEGFDAGVRFGGDVARDMIALPIGPPLEYAVVGATNYLEKHGTPKNPDSLSQHDCIRQTFSSGGVLSWSFSKGQKQIRVLPVGRLTLNNAHYIVRAAREGNGLAMVPKTHAISDLAAGTLVRILEPWTPKLPAWHLYYPSRRHTSPAFRAFIDLVKRRHG